MFYVILSKCLNVLFAYFWFRLFLQWRTISRDCEFRIFCHCKGPWVPQLKFVYTFWNRSSLLYILVLYVTTIFIYAHISNKFITIKYIIIFLIIWIIYLNVSIFAYLIRRLFKRNFLFWYLFYEYISNKNLKFKFCCFFNFVYLSPF